MAILVSALPPCVLREDEHLLVVNKPPGVNTHAPGPYLGEGIYDWLRHREPRWAQLAIIHRLDKETSGILVFAKTTLANRSLTAQFARRQVRKSYVLLTDRKVPAAPFVVHSTISRSGGRYVADRAGPDAQAAETRFKLVKSSGATSLVEAVPVTGRTHQIRVHAASRGFPVLGDALYGGTPHVRVGLHARQVSFQHPASDEEVILSSEPDFERDPRQALREAFIEPQETNAFRLVHGAGDRCAGWYVDRLGDYVLAQSEDGPDERRREELMRLLQRVVGRGAYHRRLERRTTGSSPDEASPQRLLGAVAPERFCIRENGLEFELSFGEGGSVGLFLDQRDNRRRLLERHVAAGFPLLAGPALPAAEAGRDSLPAWELLNAFAYTCGFSVCAAKAGARTTSLDLSRKYLDWGRRNFALNGLEATGHDFIYGDTMGWLRRLAKQGRAFDVVVLDPPTFSRSREHGTFRAETDFGKLVGAALPLVRREGVLFASTNAARFRPDSFLEQVSGAVTAAGRRILQQHYVPQPPDFPIDRVEPAYLKTVWIRAA